MKARSKSSAHQRGYGVDWRKLREWHIRRQPLCQMCLGDGVTTAATQVDHIVRVQDRPDLRLDPDNLQSLCDRHHHSTKQADERRGYSTQVGRDGWPVDPDHPMNQR